MQAFYDRLVSGTKGDEPYLMCLVQLTRVNLAQITALASDLAWDQWGAEVA